MLNQIIFYNKKLIFYKVHSFQMMFNQIFMILNMVYDYLLQRLILIRKETEQEKMFIVLKFSVLKIGNNFVTLR